MFIAPFIMIGIEKGTKYESKMTWIARAAFLPDEINCFGEKLPDARRA